MMDSSTGWLLDVSIEQNRATIWIKTSEGAILKLVDPYQPNFYVLPKDEYAGAELFQILSKQTTVKKVEWEDKFTDLFDDDGHGMKKLICVYPYSKLYYQTVLKSLERDPRVDRLFNTDLSHVQQYLFTKLKIEPTSKVEVQYDKNESRLIKITKINEDDELGAAPPPFSILHFEIQTSSPYNFTPHDVNDQITEIRVRYQEEPEISLEGSEDIILKDFCDYVLTKDPDILFSSNQHFRTFDYLFVRALIGLDRHIGKGPVDVPREENVNNFDNNKGNNKEIILIKKQQQVGGSFADANNASQASHVSQTLVESGDASGGYNGDASQASQSKSCNTIYRLGRSDIFACQYCRLRGDKWEMRQHPCRGSKI